MIYGSVCSGIEAASVAWHPLGWRAAFLSEIEAFPRAVLSHHYLDVPLHGDFTTIQQGQYEPIELLVGGTPCQSFSVAGLRGGMADERGNLALEYLRLAGRLRPRWLVWENVPGVLSSAGGRDFGSFLGGLVQLGYGFSYRVLDAQFFGLAQRRKRVFVVGYLGDWRRAAAVLFEPASLRGHPAPSRTAGQIAANALTDRPDRGGGNSEGQRLIANPLGAKRDGGWRGDLDNATYVADIAPALSRSNPYGDHESREGLLVAATLEASAGRSRGSGTPIGLLAHTLTGHHGRLDGESDTLIVGTLSANGKASGSATQQDAQSGMLVTAFDWYASSQQTMPVTAECPPLKTTMQPAVAFDLAQITSEANRTRVEPRAPVSTLNAAGDMHVAQRSAVRRLTPRECERLQGFPGDYTLIPYCGKPAADGPRYRALGNSMAVPCMAWIGRRIEAQEVEIQAAIQAPV